MWSKLKLIFASVIIFWLTRLDPETGKTSLFSYFRPYILKTSSVALIVAHSSSGNRF